MEIKAEELKNSVNFFPGKPYEHKELSEEELKGMLKSYGYHEKDGYVHLTCHCDSTLAFLVQMVSLLQAIGCKDIQTEGYEDKNFDGPYRFVYHAFGKKGRI